MYLYRNKIIDWFDVDNLFFRNGNGDILFELYIPRIDLRKFVYNMNSDLNDVDSNVEILKSSRLDNNLFFLAGHSGGGSASYFDDLVYLEKGDFVWINGSDKICVFVVDDIFYIQKNGYFEIGYNHEYNTLFLITCSLKYVDRQLVVRCILIYSVK